MSEINKDKPYMLKDGTLVIPFSCPDHTYKYWKAEGKQLSEILTDLEVDEETWNKFTTEKFPSAKTQEDES